MPGIRDWGLFLASTPSFTFREIPDGKMCRKIQNIVPCELVSAHLFYSEQVNKALAAKNVVHYFIYRDPRDVVVSEAHYLYQMNKWHKLSKYFRRMHHLKDRCTLAIKGMETGPLADVYPDIKKRFERYAGWLNNENVFPVKYESLIGQNQKETIAKMIDRYSKYASLEIDKKRVLNSALENINPYRSHTFRKGGSGGWCKVFDRELIELFKEHTGSLLIALGYEKNSDW